MAISLIELAIPYRSPAAAERAPFPHQQLTSLSPSPLSLPSSLRPLDCRGDKSPFCRDGAENRRLRSFVFSLGNGVGLKADGVFRNTHL